MADISSANTLTNLHEGMREQVQQAEKSVNDSLRRLNEKSDDPALLANMRHRTNLWSNVFQVEATVARSIKDLLSAILSKF